VTEFGIDIDLNTLCHILARHPARKACKVVATVAERVEAPAEAVARWFSGIAERTDTNLPI
jgi:hypothetical protein